MKIEYKDLENKIWTVIVSFGSRKLQLKFNPKTDEGDWEWLGDSTGSLVEMNEAKDYIVKNILIPELNNK